MCLIRWRYKMDKASHFRSKKESSRICKSLGLLQLSHLHQSERILIPYYVAPVGLWMCFSIQHWKNPVCSKTEFATESQPYKYLLENGKLSSTNLQHLLNDTVFPHKIRHLLEHELPGMPTTKRWLICILRKTTCKSRTCIWMRLTSLNMYEKMPLYKIKCSISMTNHVDYTKRRPAIFK